MVTSATTDNQTFLADVPQELVFWCNDGQILKNLKELRDALAIMNDYTFTYHVNEAKNDFHNWVKDIVRDDTLATQLLRAGSPLVAVRVVTDRISFLSAKPASVPVRTPAAARAKTPASKSLKKPSSTQAKSPGSRKQTRG